MDETPVDRGLNYLPCRYGRSRLIFRGPKQYPDGDCCVILGGSETFGKFVEQPFPALTGQAAGVRVVNLGCMNAGADVFANDPAILEICAGARLTVVQVMGAHNGSNRFYSVHPRRNDRFLRASGLLKALFPEVDFTEFHFTRHMLRTLNEISPPKMAMVVRELQEAWVARMRTLAGHVGPDAILLALGGHQAAAAYAWHGLGPEPLFVDRAMINEVAPLFAETLTIEISEAAAARGMSGMVFGPGEQAAAQEMPNVAAHSEIAAALAPVVRRMMGRQE